VTDFLLVFFKAMLGGAQTDKENFLVSCIKRTFMDMTSFTYNRTYVELLRCYTQWLRRLHSIRRVVTEQPGNEKAKRIHDSLLFRLIHINITLEKLEYTI